MKLSKKVCQSLAVLALLANLAACGDSDSSSSSDTDTSTSDSSGTDNSGTDNSGSDNSGSSSSSGSISVSGFSDISLGDCELDTSLESLVCAANALIDTLDEDELADLQLDYSDSEARTVWSNLPTGNVSRNGIELGALDDESLEAAMMVAKAALSDDGYQDFLGVIAADDYLNELGGGSAYSSGKYYLAFFGDPDVSGDWMLQLGGHHLAYNITYLNGDGYPVPNHIGTEPKVSFELDSASYAPLADEGDALVAMFDSLSESELAEAYLSGESYSDVLMGPDNGSGTLPTDYPTGDNRKGLLVSSLTQDQQALVTAAIEQWINDYPEEVVENLTLSYVTSSAYADTYIAWAGTESAGVDVDVAGTYMRIDGPNLWIEVACQNGIIISGETHYHTIFRDKSWDYGNNL